MTLPPPSQPEPVTTAAEEPQLLQRLAALSAELQRQKAQASEAIARVRRNLEVTRRERDRRDAARSQAGILRELMSAQAAAERASEAKSLALRAVAHDLKQPLQIIVMATDRLRLAVETGEPLGERDLRQLEHIDRAADQMNAGLDALLHAARTEFGPTPTLAAVVLAPLFHSIVEACRPLAEAKGVRLRCVATASTVRSEREALASILHNFVGNAIKYTGEGGRVLLGCRRRGTTLVIQVLDSGRGIPADAIGTIFEAFTRLDAGEPGLGLGLSIAKRHAEALGHRLVCRSAPGRGSCFSVEVPLAATEAAY